VAQIRATWVGARRFDAGRPDGPVLRLDGSGETGQSPVDGVLSALAVCTGIDVVEILAKRRTPVTTLTVDVAAERADATPRRITRLAVHFDIAGPGIERVHAERAIDLALTKYCSVRASLDPAIPLAFSLTLNGDSGAVVAAGAVAGSA
jgi:putative redox protein